MREVSRKVLGLDRAPAAPPSPSPSPAVEAAPTPDAQATAERIEQAGGDVPEQRASETDRDYEVRLSNALTQLQRAQNDAATHRKRGDDAEARAQTAEARANELQTLVDGARENVEAALELAGMSAEDVARLMLEGKISRRGKYAGLPPEVRKRLEDLERKESEREKAAKVAEDARAAAERAELGRKQDLGWLGEQLPTLASQFALPAAMPNAHERILQQLYAEANASPEARAEVASAPQKVLARTLERLQQSITEDVGALLSNEASAKVLCSVPAVRDMLTRVLGLQPAPEQSRHASPASDDRGTQQAGVGPRTLTQHVASEVPSHTPGPMTDRERKARLHAAGRKVLGL
jgi:hypothetical protein